MSNRASEHPGHPGLFLTFEGGDGVGKTTQANFVRAVLEAAGHEVVSVREPGSTVLGELLRQCLLDPRVGTVSPRAELFMFEAARAQLVDEVVEPALAAGMVVVCDRFHDSTFAYQACGRGLDADAVDRANDFAVAGCLPDRTFLFDEDPATALERAERLAEPDRIESEAPAFHARVRDGYMAAMVRSDARGEGRFVLVDAHRRPSEVARDVVAELGKLDRFADLEVSEETYAALDASVEADGSEPGERS